MENSLTLEQRVEMIERELNALKSFVTKSPQKPWWQKIAGIFKNDPAFDEILSLGQAIREQERVAAQS